jgi:putative intracellular protease/amidase
MIRDEGGGRTAEPVLNCAPWWAMAAAALVLGIGAPGAPEAGISLTPDWQVESADSPTGVGWADIDGNGWQDLVVTNGLDGAFAANAVYFNFGGTLSTVPGWTSSDTLSSGNLFVGDLNHDGAPDLANANMGHIPTGRAPQPHTVYFNQGGGRGFTASPGWTSNPANAFSLSAGDPDNDGDLDLAFGQGASAVNPADVKYQRVVIYFNDNGRFGPAPGWESDSTYVVVDIDFADIDDDGDHDLAITGRGFGLAVFYNHGGRIETTPSWQTREILGGRQMAFGDVDGDGFPDLAMAGVDEYGKGRGTFLLFRNRGGTLERKPSWVCDRYIEPSAVAWADVDGDGDLDLGGGGWNTHVGVFENLGGRLSDAYVWMNTPGWLQQIAWADYDENGLVPRTKTFRGDGRRKLLDLGEKALHEISEVEINGVRLDPAAYCDHPVEGWVSMATAPAPGSTVTVHYTGSTNLDLAATTLGRIRVYKNRPQIIPADVHLLVLLDDDLGANYNFSTSHDLLGPVDNNIRKHFERYGWRITEAAVAGRVDSCSVSGAPFGSRGETVDVLVSEIQDLSPYDAVILAPGREHRALLNSPEALDLIRSAVNEGRVVGAWCRAVRVLAKAGVIRGRRVGGNPDYRAEYEAAGAVYAGSDVPPVIDGNIVTCARSRYYRTEMCEAIATAIAENRARRSETH